MSDREPSATDFLRMQVDRDRDEMRERTAMAALAASENDRPVDPHQAEPPDEGGGVPPFRRPRVLPEMTSEQAERLRAKTEAYAVEINGQVELDTVSTSHRGAAVRWLVGAGFTRLGAHSTDNEVARVWNRYSTGESGAGLRIVLVHVVNMGKG